MLNASREAIRLIVVVLHHIHQGTLVIHTTTCKWMAWQDTFQRYTKGRPKETQRAPGTIFDRAKARHRVQVQKNAVPISVSQVDRRCHGDLDLFRLPWLVLGKRQSLAFQFRNGFRIFVLGIDNQLCFSLGLGFAFGVDHLGLVRCFHCRR